MGIKREWLVDVLACFIIAVGREDVLYYCQYMTMIHPVR